MSSLRLSFKPGPCPSHEQEQYQAREAAHGISGPVDSSLSPWAFSSCPGPLEDPEKVL